MSAKVGGKTSARFTRSTHSHTHRHEMTTRRFSCVLRTHTQHTHRAMNDGRRCLTRKLLSLSCLLSLLVVLQQVMLLLMTLLSCCCLWVLLRMMGCWMRHCLPFAPSLSFPLFFCMLITSLIPTHTHTKSEDLTFPFRIWSAKERPVVPLFGARRRQ